VLSLTELGKRLKEAREQKNLSLDDVQTLTKIQKRYLVGIEEGNYALMPGKFYIPAFIKQYAEAVGLDPEIIFEEFKDEIPSTNHEALPEQLSRVKSRKTISIKGNKIMGILPKVLTAIVILLAAVAIWVIAQKNSSGDTGHKQINNAGDNSAEMEKSANTSSKTNNKKTEDKSSSTDIGQKNDSKTGQKEQSSQKVDVIETKDGNSTLQLSNTDQFNLELSSTGKTWVQISNGSGKTFFSGTLTTDSPVQKNDFTNETEILLNIGNSLDTVIKINGEDVTFPVDPKDNIVQQITIRFQK
jgi:cytoskeletal protein RodZ